MALLSMLRSFGLNRSDLEFIKPLEKRLTCPVCQYVLWGPMELSCGHHVCYGCYCKFFQYNNTATCPVGVDDNCKNIKRNEVKYNGSVFNEVIVLKVKCPYSKYGCSDVMCLFELEWHFDKCQDIIAPCNNNCGIKPMKRRELSSHFKICSKKECEYKFYGCDFKGTTEQMAEHDEKTVHQHLKLVTVYTRTINSDPSARQQVGHVKHGEEQGRLVPDLLEKVNNLTLQIKKIDSAAVTQFDSMNAMTDAFSKQLSAHGKQLEDHDVRIAEMETESYKGVVILKKKKGDNRRKQDSINEKSTYPSWHKEVLKKHYETMMKNIRVNDIMDQLFGREVMSENDMDIIKTKLESKGNREALRYLMDILFKSSHTALTTFIHCLNKTGYEYIATSLQEDIDNYGCGGDC